MRADAARHRQRVDQVLERYLGGAAEVVALGEVGARNLPGVEPRDLAGQRRRFVPGGNDELPAGYAHRRRAADLQREAAVLDEGALQRRLEGGDRAVFLGLHLQRLKQGKRVDHAGRRRQQRRMAAQRRFEPPCLRAVKAAQVVDAVGDRGGGDPVELLVLARRGSHHELAASDARHAVEFGEGIEHLATGHAEARLEAAGRIVQAGMNDPAAASRASGTEPLGSLQAQHLPSVPRQLAGDRQPDNAGTDDDAIHMIQRDFSSRAEA